MAKLANLSLAEALQQLRLGGCAKRGAPRRRAPLYIGQDGGVLGCRYEYSAGRRGGAVT